MKYSKLKLAALATITVVLVTSCGSDYQPSQPSVAVPIHQEAGQPKVYEIQSVALVEEQYVFETRQGEKITLDEKRVGISTRSASIGTLEQQLNGDYIYYRPSRNANSSYYIPYYATRSSAPIQIELDFDMTPNRVYHLPARTNTTVVNNTIVVNKPVVRPKVYVPSTTKSGFTNPKRFTNPNPIKSPAPNFKSRDTRVTNGTILSSPKPQVSTGYTSTNKAGGTNIRVAPSSNSAGMRGMGGGTSVTRPTSRSSTSSFRSSSSSSSRSSSRSSRR